MLKKSITPYGAFIRKYRISHFVGLDQFVANLGMSKNYLLDLEIGNEPLPADFEEKLVDAVNFDDVSRINLHAAIALTMEQQDQERKEAEMMLADANGIRTPKIIVQLDEGAVMPSRAHESDAGFDLYAKQDCTLLTGASVTIGTGVHMYIPEGYCGLICPRSGMVAKKYLVANIGVIDAGYTGEIKVSIHNTSQPNIMNNRHPIYKYDRIAQLLIIPVLTPELELGDVTGMTSERGENGFGSTGA